ncbi:methyltransferase [Nocardia sp. NBC_01730]|uniref:methyltransferase n=1 Tax=Nocardia sp. NBC_01730 TaxID=2975998 RepID=UPI002E0D9077|nr:methyltransferase [Nocardia sp. NBC_01730]
MSKLTRSQAAAHREACSLVELDRDLDEGEKLFVLEHYQESTSTTQSADGAFFTPLGLARDMRIEVVGTRILDLGAGIGHLAFTCRNQWDQANGEPARELVCVERNPEFVRVGMKVVPEATWWCGDLLRVHREPVRPFDTVISNPPFGTATRNADAPEYRGPRFEYHVIAVAAHVARHGVFLIPQSLAPFHYSGQQGMQHDRADAEYERFHTSTGIGLEANCGIDTSYYLDQWHHPMIPTEIVTCDFTDSAVARRRSRATLTPTTPVFARPRWPDTAAR